MSKLLSKMIFKRYGRSFQLRIESTADLKAAILWTLERLKDTAGLEQKSPVLQLHALNEKSDGGKKLLESARKILRYLQKENSGNLSLEEVRKIRKQLEMQPISEAGVLLPEAAESPELAQFLRDVIQSVGGRSSFRGPAGNPFPVCHLSLQNRP